MTIAQATRELATIANSTRRTPYVFTGRGLQPTSGANVTHEEHKAALTQFAQEYVSRLSAAAPLADVRAGE